MEASTEIAVTCEVDAPSAMAFWKRCRSSCHLAGTPGAAGAGSFPRLAGQHVQYLMKQLRSFQNNMRNVAVMHGVAAGLQLGDMQAVSTYLQSLGP